MFPALALPLTRGSTGSANASVIASPVALMIRAWNPISPELLNWLRQAMKKLPSFSVTMVGLRAQGNASWSTFTGGKSWDPSTEYTE